MLWKRVSLILGSPLSRKILETLDSSDKPLAPLQISKKADIARSNVSTKLGALMKENLVVCINPDARKWRFYEITKEGKAALNEIKKMKP